jgi:hypothetical protein
MAGLGRRRIAPLKRRGRALARVAATLGVTLCTLTGQAETSTPRLTTAITQGSWDNLWGLLRAPDRDAPPGIQKLLFDPTLRGREAILSRLAEPYPASPSARLALARSAHRWLKSSDDPELTVAVIRLFRQDPQDGAPLALFARETLAMVLFRSRNPLARAALIASRDSQGSPELERDAASVALNSPVHDTSNLETLLQDEEDKSPERLSAHPTAVAPLTRAPLEDLELAFLRGELWLASALAERESLGPVGLQNRAPVGPHLDRILAWLSDTSLIVRLSTAGGLGRRLSSMGPSLERELIVNELGNRYSAEPSPLVRRALVIAIGRARLHHEVDPGRLQLAEELDPDAVVRCLARLALSDPERLAATSLGVPAEPPSHAPETGSKQPPERPEFALDGTPCFSRQNCQILLAPGKSPVSRKP